MTRSLCAGVVASALLAPLASAETKDAWSFEMFLGSAWNFPIPLIIRQESQSDISLTAQYDTEPLKESPYYAWRIGRWTEGRAWELELVHHKVYLRNEPSDVQHFEISHGYNLITVNRAWPYKGLTLRLGGGLVVAHPETKIRNQEFPADAGALGLGFFIAGPTGQATIAKKFYFKKGFFGTIETKFTMSYAWVPIVDGDADAPVIAVHGLFGLGYEF